MKRFITKNIILVSFLLFSLESISAATITATGGNWNAPGSWDLGRVPACGDIVVIPLGISIHIAANVNLDGAGCAPLTIQCAGSITFANGRKIRLSAGGCVQVSLTGIISPSGGGGGASELIEIAGENWWQASFGTLFGTAAGVNLGCGVLLPIELTNFSFENIDTKVLIQWTTASERENDYFFIEHSKDGHYWEEVGIVKGAGNSSVELSYELIDKNPFFGKSYYRISQFDINGISTVLSTQTNELVSTKYLLYPIPVNKSMFLEGNNLANSIVTILNSVGEIIEVEQSIMGDKISFNFSEVKNGAYFVSIQNDNTKKTERIIVVHK
ncbi:MAG: T9SS type A sorting domain-containing protein [Bacteroidota bacterium]